MYEIDDDHTETHWLTILWVAAFVPAVFFALFVVYQTNMFPDAVHKTIMLFNLACLFQASPTRDLYSKENSDKAENSYTMLKQMEGTREAYTRLTSHEIGATPTLKF
jgi:hypothetical protein